MCIRDRHSEFNKETHVAFIDFEKALYRVDRNLLWKILKEWEYAKELIRILQVLCNGKRIAIENNCKISQQISINLGRRQ